MAALNRGQIGWIAVLALMLTLPLWASGSISTVILILIYMSASLAWGFLAEYGGIVSLGQQVFIGLGMYGMIIFGTNMGIPMIYSIALSAAMNVALALALSTVIFKLRGAYLAIGTWILAEAFELIFTYWGYVGAATGATYEVAYLVPLTDVYYALLILTAGVAALIYYLYETKFGLGIRAVGSNEDVAKERGVNVALLKTIIFVFSALVSSLVGSLYILYNAYVSPSIAFSITWIVTLIFVNIIGGRGRIIGAAIGSIIYVAIVYLTTGLSEYSLLIEGLIIIAAWFLVRRGVWSLIADRISIKAPL
jgi:branched-chain amino acid transport system permease protein